MPKEDYDIVMTELNEEKLEFWFPKTKKELMERLDQAMKSKELIEELINERQSAKNLSIVDENEEENISLKKHKKMIELEINLVEEKLKALESKKEN